MIFRILFLAVLVAGLSACGLMDRRDDDQRSLYEPTGRTLQLDQDDEGIVFDPDEDEEDEFAETEIYPGTGVFFDEETASRRPDDPPVEDGEITLNFEGTGIQEVVHGLLGHFLEESYVIAPGVSGEVTFSTARPITREQVMPILEMLLGWTGSTLIWREGRYHVLPVSDAVRGNLVPRLSRPDQVRGYEVLAVPLEYVAPGQMAELLEPYAQDGGVFQADNARGLLFMAGTRYELRNYMQIIETFDVDWLAGMSIGLFSLERVEVGEIAAELESVFGEGAETPLAGMFRFVPMERLNAMMVITPQEHYLHEAEKWITRLDRATTGASARLYVYRVKNLEADILASYLADLFGTGQAGAPRRERRGGVAPGLEEARATSVGEFQQQQRQDQQQPRDQQRREQPRGGQGGVTLGDGEVRITAVLETNSLLIQASPQEYDAILNAIERLDEEPLQVLIEAQIIEVTLTEALRFGVSWFIANSHPDAGGPSLPEDSDFNRRRSQNRMEFGQDTDFFSTVTRRGIDRTFVTGIIEALDNESDTRTLSTPSLMVRNNAEARINVGDQVPVQSQRIIGGIGDGRSIGSAQYVNTGTILEVTPRVNPGGLVYMRVRQEISAPRFEDAPDGGNPPISTREVSTEVAVQSGQTIVLGGLISETDSRGEGGLPGLRRIPLIGPLFGRKSHRTDRTETLVLITPTVIDSSRTLEEVSNEFQKKFRGLEPLRGEKTPVGELP